MLLKENYIKYHKFNKNITLVIFVLNENTNFLNPKSLNIRGIVEYHHDITELSHVR